MPYQQAQEKLSEFFGWCRNYVICPEAIQIYAVIGTAILIRNRVGGDFMPSGQELQQTIREQSYILVPAATTISVNMLNGYMSRCRENRDLARVKRLRSEELRINEMSAHHREGEQALLQHEYYSAVENFMSSRNIFTKMYDQNLSSRAKQLYLSSTYKQALALYYLKRYSEAKMLLDDILHNATYSNAFHARIEMLNLRGLINFTEGLLPGNNLSAASRLSPHWQEAEKDFEESYKAMRGQNSIYFYLQYLRGNFKFLAHNIPNESLNPKINFIFNERDMMLNQIILLCADACHRQDDWGKAIFLYENQLESLFHNSKNFLELSLLNLECFKAYKMIIAASTDKQYETLLVSAIETDEQGEIKIIAEEKRISIAELKGQAVVKLETAMNYLEAELFLISDTLELINTRIHYGHTYIALTEALDSFQYDGKALPRKSDLNNLAIVHFKEAQKLLQDLPRENLLLEKVNEMLKKLEEQATLKNRR